MGVYEKEAEGRHYMRKLAAANSVKGMNPDCEGSRRSQSITRVAFAKEDVPVVAEQSSNTVSDSLDLKATLTSHEDPASKIFSEIAGLAEKPNEHQSAQTDSSQKYRPSQSRSNSGTGHEDNSHVVGRQGFPFEHSEMAEGTADLRPAKLRTRSPLGPAQPIRYTSYLKSQPPRTFIQSLKPWNGRLRQESWLRVAIRPFILFAYPAVLWSALVYSLSVGWLIVLSETVAHIYRSKPYNFSALTTGCIYVSPLIGGILGTAVAGKGSDLIVRFMSRRNGGVYEPEFRLIAALPIGIATSIGLMGFGWTAQEHDPWILPTVFFGIISFGCCLGSTTAITFCVDSYRQYAGEALVTLNFSKSESALSNFLSCTLHGCASVPVLALLLKGIS